MSTSAEQDAEEVQLAFYDAGGNILQMVGCRRGAIGLQSHPQAAGFLELPSGFPFNLHGKYRVVSGVLVPVLGCAVSCVNGTETLQRDAATLLVGGLTAEFGSKPALSGTYAVGATAQLRLQAEMLALLANSKFANGKTTINYPDIAGARHTFDPASFRSLATAIAAFVSALIGVMEGEAGATLPPSTVTLP